MGERLNKFGNICPKTDVKWAVIVIGCEFMIANITS